MTREVSRENSQDAQDKDPRAVRPDQPQRTKDDSEIARLVQKLNGID